MDMVVGGEFMEVIELELDLVGRIRTEEEESIV